MEGLPLYLQVKNDLNDKIKNGIWQVDEKIPSEVSLMSEYRVGRETVRKAISILIQEDLLYRKRGIGTFVKRSYSNSALEPLISLSGLMKVRGHQENNKIKKIEKLVIDEKLHEITKMPIGMDIVYIERKRFIDSEMIGYEKCYIPYEEDVDNYDFESSISTFIIKQRALKIGKLEQNFEMHIISEDEKKLFNMQSEKLNNELIRLQRWTYVRSQKEVYFYVDLLIKTDIYHLSI